MRRIIILDHNDAFKHEVSTGDVDALDVVEEINGNHTLTISTTTLRLTIGDKVLAPRTQASSAFRLFSEWVVYGAKTTHDRSGAQRTEYTCIWFVQYEAMGVYVDTSVGVVPFQTSTPTSASNWFAGTLAHVDGENDNPTWELLQSLPTMASSTFYHMDGWECIKRFVERWGGEIDGETTVMSVLAGGPSKRQFIISPRLGRSSPTARFDFGWNVDNIERTVHDGVWGCRVVPLGKSTQTENGGYTRRPTIESVNNGVPWLQNGSVVTSVVRPQAPTSEHPDVIPNFYPTVIVKNDVYEDPAELKAWALEHLEELTTPKVTYKVSVVDLGEMGYKSSQIQLGDTVMVVDKELAEGGLRIKVRVQRIEYSMIGDNRPVKLTLGNANPSITTTLQDNTNAIGVIREQLDLQQTT